MSAPRGAGSAAGSASEAAGAAASEASRSASDIVRKLEDINFVYIAVVLLLAWALMRGVEWLLPRLAALLPVKVRFTMLQLVPALRMLVVVAAVLLVVPQVIEPTMQNLFAILGAVGIAVGFAFKDYVSSLIAGMVAIYEQPYRQGDWVEVGGVYGEVRSVGTRALALATPDDDVVTVPHLKLWTERVSNANDGQRTLMVVTSIYLAPDHDAAAVRERLGDVILTSAYLDVARPWLVVLAEEPWGTHYKLKAYPVNARDQFLFESDLTVRAKAVLSAMGCRFAVAPALAAGDRSDADPADGSGVGL